ncbi:MAG: hypothetical protein IPK23_13830 [Rhizobiales bacterium]|nr:hypothetical protein [Hyphomicrobiales bacterium]
MLAGDIRGGDAIVSAISFTTFAGLTAALVPWLLCSGTLTLLDFPERVLSETDRNTHLIASLLRSPPRCRLQSLLHLPFIMRELNPLRRFLR